MITKLLAALLALTVLAAPNDAPEAVTSEPTTVSLRMMGETNPDVVDPFGVQVVISNIEVDATAGLLPVGGLQCVILVPANVFDVTAVVPGDHTAGTELAYLWGDGLSKFNLDIGTWTEELIRIGGISMRRITLMVGIAPKFPYAPSNYCEDECIAATIGLVPTLRTGAGAVIWDPTREPGVQDQGFIRTRASRVGGNEVIGLVLEPLSVVVQKK